MDTTEHAFPQGLRSCRRDMGTSCVAGGDLGSRWIVPGFILQSLSLLLRGCSLTPFL